MMVSCLNRHLGMLFLMACFAALMNPPPYILIGAIFFIMGLVMLPSTNKIMKQKFDREIKGGIKTAVILAGFLLVCLVVPQVPIQNNSFSTNYAPIAESK